LAAPNTSSGVFLKSPESTVGLVFPEVLVMTFLLVLLIGGFAIAAATALVRGLMAFFRDGENLHRTAKSTGEAFGEKQNRMMTQRVIFQGIAVLLVVLVGALAGAR
jgi:Hypoxia induced protein conserved region